MKVYLKIKIKSLAEEAKMIRREERKQNPGHRARVRARRYLAGKTKACASHETHARKQAEAKKVLRQRSEKAMDAFFGLRHHRTIEVRDESRSSHVAYGFLRGLDYKRVENSAKTEPDWTRVEQLVKKYGEGDVRDRMQRFSEWKSAATAA